MIPAAIGLGLAAVVFAAIFTFAFSCGVAWQLRRDTRQRIAERVRCRVKRFGPPLADEHIATEFDPGIFPMEGNP